MKAYFLLSILTLQTCIMFGSTPERGIVGVSVADLVGQSQKELGAKKADLAYTKMPICGDKGDTACLRIHQLLFNEVVTIVEEDKDEVKIKIPHLFFETEKDTTPFDIYWTLKKNIISFRQLKKHHINLAHIPHPLSYKEKKIESTQPIITLVAPYFDAKTGITFSAGTRFVAHANQPSTQTYMVYALDPQRMTMQTLALPRTSCYAHQALTREQKIALFVEIMKRWAHQTDGFIPYVWGGCSFTNLCTIDTFMLKETADRVQPISWYQRPDSKQQHTGFDCTGLVARATQLAGIPYFFKNTTTIAKYLKPLEHTTPLQAGDIIWFPSHVMVVADLKKNTIIEARHYNHGYGKVHELPLHEVFKNIKTFKQLQNHFFKQKPLFRLHINGSVAQTISTFKLLRLASVWD